ncbi:hypothetical protein QN277_004521 [Acacia crassicarpa]|uniref:Secreted protein n=1 Tax=Acacia crassicarpa TaxID=499986 RepID=A0AAE1MIH0_9FABA|nr:hypothetical protein QN277_004521 [Acacia crassicarpa]
MFILLPFVLFPFVLSIENGSTVEGGTPLLLSCENCNHLFVLLPFVLSIENESTVEGGAPTCRYYHARIVTVSIRPCVSFRLSLA